jgi:hypothetical protein
MWSFPTMSHASLIDTYIAALNLTEVTIVASPDGRRCRIDTGGEIALARCEKIVRQFYFKKSHAELVLATIDKEGATDQAPAAVAALIEFWTPEQLRKAAAEQVAEITERVKTAGLSGKLKRWNAAYKQYRLAQVAKAEKAIPYSSFLEQFVVIPTVRQIAATGRMI